MLVEQNRTEPTIFEPRLKFMLRLKFFKFSLWLCQVKLKLQNMSYNGVVSKSMDDDISKFRSKLILAIREIIKYPVRPRKMQSKKTTDCKPQVRILKRSMNMKHINCAVNTDQFHLRVNFQTTCKKICFIYNKNKCT